MDKTPATPRDPPTEQERSSARQRPRSLSRGTERRTREREGRGPPLEAAPAARTDPAPPRAGPAPREAPPPRTPATGWGAPPGPSSHRTPAAATGRGEPAETTQHHAPAATGRGEHPAVTPHRTAEPPLAPSGAHAETPQRMQLEPAAARSAAPATTPLPPTRAKRPTGSPKSNLESDFIIVHRLLKANLISGDLAKTIAMSLNDRQRLLDEAGARTPDEEEMEAVCNYAALTPLPETEPPTTLKRQRTDTDLRQGDAATKVQRVTTQDEPLPQRERDPRIRRTTASRTIEMDCATSTSSSMPTTDPRPTSSFADAARTPKKPADTATSSGASQVPPPTQTGPAPATGPKSPRYPPLIVETLPNWAHHLRQLKTKLGRTPSARPFGKGIKFSPADDQEYRLIQRYLTDLEKEENVSWFSYSLPQERSLKVAIRGIPAETDPEDIADELRTLGFLPEVVRPIRARQGRPGCIFFAVLKRTPDLIPAIYGVDELLCMPGITIEAWRGKKGPAQCHRCQKFRHSSHNCHRRQACVRCGEEHSAHECPRPREEPATCANCGGPHPSNNVSCPVFRREARNKRAGTVATTTGPKMEQSRPKPRPSGDEEGAAHSAPSGSNIRTEANEATPRGAIPKGQKKKKKTKKGKRKGETVPAPAPASTQEAKKGKPDRPAVIETAIQILSDILLALRAGEDPVDVVLRGMSSILKLNG